MYELKIGQLQVAESDGSFKTLDLASSDLSQELQRVKYSVELLEKRIVGYQNLVDLILENSINDTFKKYENEIIAFRDSTKKAENAAYLMKQEVEQLIKNFNDETKDELLRAIAELNDRVDTLEQKLKPSDNLAYILTVHANTSDNTDISYFEDTDAEGQPIEVAMKSYSDCYKGIVVAIDPIMLSAASKQSKYAFKGWTLDKASTKINTSIGTAPNQVLYSGVGDKIDIYAIWAPIADLFIVKDRINQLSSDYYKANVTSLSNGKLGWGGNNINSPCLSLFDGEDAQNAVSSTGIFYSNIDTSDYQYLYYNGGYAASGEHKGLIIKNDETGKALPIMHHPSASYVHKVDLTDIKSISIYWDLFKWYTGAESYAELWNLKLTNKNPF